MLAGAQVTHHAVADGCATLKAHNTLARRSGDFVSSDSLESPLQITEIVIIALDLPARHLISDKSRET